MKNNTVENHPMSLLAVSRKVEVEDVIESSSAMPDPFNMGKFLDEIERKSHQSEGDMDDDDNEYCPSDESSTEIESELPRGFTEFLELNEISIPYLSVNLVLFYRGMQKIKVFHDCAELQVCCKRLKVRFGISKKYFDYAGRPQLNFVVNATANLCMILDEINNHAQRLCVDSGSSFEWRPIVSRNPGYENFPTVRFQ